MIKNVCKAKSLKDALYILSEKKSSVKIIAGGTDLIIDIKNCKLDKEALVDISDLEELRFIKEENGFIKIGTCTTFNEIINSKIINSNLHGLKKAASLVGSPQIRSRGTIGGNICNASPSADMIPPLLALDAKVFIQSKNNYRKEYLKNILKDKNKINIRDDEILTYIEFKNLSKHQILSFSKLGIRKSLSISRISVSVLLDIEENIFNNIKIALGSVNNIARREHEVEEYLSKKIVNSETIDRAIEILQRKMQENLKGRSSKEFKCNAVRGVLKDAINEGLRIGGLK